MEESRFRGKYRYTIDEKGRINIPSKFRKCMSPAANDTMVITRGTEGCLTVYPMDKWSEFERKLSAIPTTQKNIRYKRLLLDSISDSSLDKQGRIALTPEQIKLAGIKKEVLIIGDIEKMQVWDPERYNSEMDTALEGVSYDQYYYDAMRSLSGPENDKE